MKVWAVTVTWTPSAESDDYGVYCHPVTALELFSDALRARTRAEELVKEHNLHHDDDAPDEPLESLSELQEDDRGIVQAKDDGWIIRNDYDVVFIDIYEKEVA